LQFFGRPFVKRFALCYRTVVLSVVSVLLSVCDVGVLWPSGWMDQDATWRAGRPWLRPHCVRWNQLPSPKGHSPQFSANVRCGQMAGWIKMPLGVEVGLSPGDFMLDGDPAPPPQKGDRAPNFRPMSIVAMSVAASRVQHISDLHSKFALRPHHVWKYGRHPICGR